MSRSINTSVEGIEIEIGILSESDSGVFSLKKRESKFQLLSERGYFNIILDNDVNGLGKDLF